MRSDVLAELDHAEVRDRLVDYLREYVRQTYGSQNDVDVQRETSIDSPYYSSPWRPDVVIDREGVEYNQPGGALGEMKGCAFEVKTRRRDVQRAARQLEAYLVAGYQPVLVTPGCHYLDESGSDPPFRWVVEASPFTFPIEIVSASPIRFSPMHGTLYSLAMRGLEEFLMETTLVPDNPALPISEGP